MVTEHRPQTPLKEIGIKGRFEAARYVVNPETGNLTHLIGTGDNRWELVSFFLLTFDHGLEDGGMIGS